MAEDIRVVALLHTKPGLENEVRNAALACIAPSRAEATNRLYVLHQDSEDPQLLVFIEHWDSKAALDDHMQTPHFKQLAGSIDGKLTQPLDVHVLQPF